MPYFIKEKKRERAILGLDFILQFIYLLWKAKPYYWHKPTKQQIRFLACVAPYQVLVAGTRFGKSMWTSLKVAAYMWFMPQITGMPLRCWCVCPKYDLGEKEFRWIKEAFQDLEKYLGVKLIAKLTDSQQGGKFFMKLVNGSTIRVVTVGNKNEINVLGDEVDIIIFSESARQKEFEWLFEANCVRALINREGFAIFPSTPHGFGYFRKLYLRGKDINPLWNEYVSLGPYTNLQGGGVTKEKFVNAYLTLSEEAFLEQWCGQFIMMSGHVYKEFSEKNHVISQLPPMMRRKSQTLYCGIDWGFRNPFAMAFALRDNDKRYYFFDEIYEVGLTNQEKANLAKQRLKGWSRVFIYVDPEDAEAGEVFSRNGINTTLANNAVRDGIFTVKDYMRVQPDGKPRVFYVRNPGKNGEIIYQGVPHLIDEKYKYRWKDKRDSQNEHEEPLDLDNHQMDAERYIIQTVEEGEMVEKAWSRQASVTIEKDKDDWEDKLFDMSRKNRGLKI